MPPINEYDALIEQVTGTRPEPPNQYDSIIEEGEQTFDQAISESMFAASRKNPDKEADIIRLSEQAGVPRETAGRNFDQLKSQVELNSIDYNRLMTDAPITARSLSDRDFAMVGQDDIANLTGFEWLFAAVPKAFEQGQMQVETGEIGFRQIQGTATPEEIELVEKYQADQAQWLGDNGWFQSAAVEGTKQLPQLWETLAGGAVTGIPGAIVGVELALIGGQAGPQVALPEEIVTVPGLAAAGYIAGSRFGSGAVNFKIMSGQAYQELIQIKDVDGKPLDEDVARVAALTSGLLNAGLEVLGVEKLVKIGGGDVLLDKLKGGGINRLIKIPTVQAAFKDLAVRYGKGFSTEFAIEMAQEAVNILTGELAKGVSDQEFGEEEKLTLEQTVERFTTTGVKTAQALTFLVGGGPSINFAFDLRRARNATRNQQTIIAMGDSAKASKVRARLPEKYQQFVKSVRENGKVENIYIPADKFVEYFQDVEGNLSELVEVMPEITSQINEAIATGDDIAIPLEQYAAFIAPTEHHAGLSQDIRFQPGDFTMREAEDFLSATEGRIEQEAKTAAEVSTQNAQLEEQLDIIQDQVTNELIAAGRTADIAATEALPVREFFRSMSDRAGIDPLQFFQERGLQIEGVAPGATIEDTNLQEARDVFNQLEEEQRLPDTIEDPGAVGRVDPTGEAVSLLSEEPTVTKTSAESATDFATIPDSPNNVEEAGVQELGTTDAEAIAASKQIWEALGTNSPFFQEWFQRGFFKDAQGNPRIIFHGTNNENKQEFSSERLGGATNVPSAGFGFHLTSDQEFAGAFGSNVIAAYTNIQNPFMMTKEEHGSIESIEAAKARSAELIEQGFDGIFVAAEEGNRDIIIAFDSNQIKSTENIGLFDPEQANIFQQFDELPRGKIAFSPDRSKALISLLSNANLSTFLHESGHFFLDAFSAIAATSEDPQIQSDWQAILDWLEVDSVEDIGTEQHEKWARGMEAYYFEGKAPSIELQSAFARFSQWLKRIYASLKKLNIELSDEVRGVMDRMLATDDQIEAVEQQGEITQLWENAKDAGMTESGFNRYVKKSQQAADQARVDLLNKANKEITRERKKWWREEKEKVRAQVEQEVNQRPVWQALDYLRTGFLPDNEIPEALQGVKISKRVLIDIYGSEFLATLPKPIIYQSEGGLHPDVIADMFDFDSGDAMLTDMINATRPIEEVPPEGDVKSEVDVALEDEQAVSEFVQRQQAENVRAAIKVIGSADINNPNSLKRLIGFKPVPLHLFIKNSGGMKDTDGELRARGITSKTLPGLIRRDGLDAGSDIVIGRILENGYLIDQNAARELTESDLFDAIAASIEEDNIYNEQTQAALQEFQDDFEITNFASERGITQNSSNEEILKVFDPEVEFIPEAAKTPAFRAKRKRDVIDEETEVIMQATFGDMLNDGSINEAAVDSVLNSELGDVIALELKQLEKMLREPTQIAARRDRRAATEARRSVGRVDAKFARRIAKRAIETKKLRDIRPDSYQAASLRASKKTHQAVAERDFDSAVEFKRQQLISHYMYIEGRNARDKIDKLIRYFNKFNSVNVRKNLPGEYLDQIDAILEKFDFKKTSLKKLDERKALSQWVDEQEAMGNVVNINPAILGSQRINFRNMDIETLVGIEDTVRNIEHLGRLKNQLISTRDKRNFDAVVNNIVESIAKNVDPIKESQNYSPNLKERIGDNFSKVNAELTKMEFLFLYLDGDKPVGGPAWNALFKPIADAENAAKDMMAPLTEQMNEVFNRYTRFERSKWMSNKISVPEVNKSFTKAEIFSVALNWGNEGNKRALMQGQQWSEQQVEAILANLDQKDWETVQSLLDIVNSLWPRIQTLQKELTGTTPQKVESSPIQTAFGEFPGGYFPLKFDPERSFLQFKRDERNDTKDIFGGNWLKPATKQGHVIEREGSGGQPVKLDLSVITEHIGNVVHDITHRKAIIDVDKIIQDERFREAVEQTAGKFMYRQMRPWLQSIAKDDTPAKLYWEKILAHARVGATVVNMGVKITTAVVQPIGYSQSIDVLGGKYSLLGLNEFYGVGNPEKWKENIDFVMEKSSMMRNRQKTFDRDVRDSLRKFTGTGQALEIRQSFFILTGLADMGVAMPTWMGAYKQGMDDLFDYNEEQSIAYADSIVRQTQSSGSVKDLAAIQRGGEIQRMFTMFYSYFSVLYNLFARRTRQFKKGDINLPQFVASMFFLWFFPAVLSELIAGRGPDDDEDEAEWIAKQIAGYPFQSVVGLRDISNGVIGDFGYGLTPVNDAFNAIVQASDIPRKIAEDEELDKKDIKQAVLAIGYWGHLPARQTWITGDAFYNWMTGEDVELQDFFFTPKK